MVVKELVSPRLPASSDDSLENGVATELTTTDSLSQIYKTIHDADVFTPETLTSTWLLEAPLESARCSAEALRMQRSPLQAEGGSASTKLVSKWAPQRTCSVSLNVGSSFSRGGSSPIEEASVITSSCTSPSSASASCSLRSCPSMFASLEAPPAASSVFSSSSTFSLSPTRPSMGATPIPRSGLERPAEIGNPGGSKPAEIGNPGGSKPVEICNPGGSKPVEIEVDVVREEADVVVGVDSYHIFQT